MEHYGIATEEELLSGMIMHVKNRLSDSDEVDGTLFTTNRVPPFLIFHTTFFIKNKLFEVIEGKVRRIIEIAREKFFETVSLFLFFFIKCELFVSSWNGERN